MGAGWSGQTRPSSLQAQRRSHRRSRLALGPPHSTPAALSPPQPQWNWCRACLKMALRSREPLQGRPDRPDRLQQSTETGKTQQHGAEQGEQSRCVECQRRTPPNSHCTRVPVCSRKDLRLRTLNTFFSSGLQNSSDCQPNPLVTVVERHAQVYRSHTHTHTQIHTYVEVHHTHEKQRGE
jgi:hypothetical protein